MTYVDIFEGRTADDFKPLPNGAKVVSWERIGVLKPPVYPFYRVWFDRRPSNGPAGVEGPFGYMPAGVAFAGLPKLELVEKPVFEVGDNVVDTRTKANGVGEIAYVSRGGQRKPFAVIRWANGEEETYGARMRFLVKVPKPVIQDFVAFQTCGGEPVLDGYDPNDVLLSTTRRLRLTWKPNKDGKLVLTKADVLD